MYHFIPKIPKFFWARSKSMLGEHLGA